VASSRAAARRVHLSAKDGYVSITHLFGTTVGPATRRLMEWVYDCGFCDEATRDKDWIAYTELLMTSKEPIAEFERVKRAIKACTASKTKAELLQTALDRHLLMAPARTLAEVVESEQLAARGWVQALEAPDGSTPAIPGPLRSSRFAGPLRAARAAARRARCGDRAERRVSAPRLPHPAPRAVARSRASRCSTSCGVAGPLATRAFADHGASVIRIESSRRLDVCRTILPFLRGEIGAENAALFHSTNVGKRMLTLDPSKPEAGRPCST